jgi:hypothetical protein
VGDSEAARAGRMTTMLEKMAEAIWNACGDWGPFAEALPPRGARPPHLTTGPNRATHRYQRFARLHRPGLHWRGPVFVSGSSPVDLVSNIFSQCA